MLVPIASDILPLTRCAGLRSQSTIHASFWKACNLQQTQLLWHPFRGMSEHIHNLHSAVMDRLRRLLSFAASLLAHTFRFRNTSALVGKLEGAVDEERGGEEYG